MTDRFKEVYGEMGLFRVKDNKTGKYYKAVLCGNPFTETDKPILDILNEIAEENASLSERISDLDCEIEQLKKENYELHKRLGDFEPFERYMKEKLQKHH